MLKGTIRAALVMAAMAGTAASVGAAELDPNFDAEGVRIMNNHGETIRVFAEVIQPEGLNSCLSFLG